VVFKRSYDEGRLLQLLAEDSHYAFTQIFDNYKDSVYGVSFRILKSHLLAQEIVQDVFLKIWLKRTELMAIENFAGFLFVTARNLTFDRLKQLAYESMLKKELSGREEATSIAENRVQYQQYVKVLSEAVNLLPPQQKQVYLLSKESGLSHAQIGEQLKISKLTVKKHLVVAMKFIREYFTKNLGTIIRQN
jgi:RNA polymerase sigma-70 factor (family 1)